jgi:anaerobic ribonucleoside-triphosphate reductase activating protein
MLNINQVAFGLKKHVLGATESRMGVWVQGCSLSCSGCSSVHTWAPRKGKKISIDSLLRLAKMQKTKPTGLIISGGEPANQADMLTEFIRAFREAFPSSEVILFTGLSWKDFHKEHRQLKNLLDVVVAGPYDQTLPATPLAGSSNQEIKLLTPLAKDLYRDWKSWPMHIQQISAIDPGSVTTVGIPDTYRMAQAADELSVAKVTWQQPVQKQISNNLELVDDE